MNKANNVLILLVVAVGVFIGPHISNAMHSGETTHIYVLILNTFSGHILCYNYIALFYNPHLLCYSFYHCFLHSLHHNLPRITLCYSYGI